PKGIISGCLRHFQSSAGGGSRRAKANAFATYVLTLLISSFELKILSLLLNCINKTVCVLFIPFLTGAPNGQERKERRKEKAFRQCLET
ncbi:MAG: hypothetical protein J5743_12420, partial [Victivallales bacterium]|nr:hypothetical protein [Victivallales bacterium]